MSFPDKVTLSDGTTVYLSKYHREDLARQASRPGQKRSLVLGDVDDKWGKFWVCTGKVAGKLVKDGFEHAPSLYGIVREG